MRVKIDDTWYNGKDKAICVELDGHDKYNLSQLMKSEETFKKYAVFPDNDPRTDEELFQWMREE